MLSNADKLSAICHREFALLCDKIAFVARSGAWIRPAMPAGLCKKDGSLMSRGPVVPWLICRGRSRMLLGSFMHKGLMFADKHGIEHDSKSGLLPGLGAYIMTSFLFFSFLFFSFPFFSFVLLLLNFGLLSWAS